MDLNAWAIKWQIPAAALADLRAQMGMTGEAPSGPVEGLSESAVQGRVRLRESSLGGRVWRNNIGAGVLQDGSFIRWGLANDSAAMNERIKSADLIGIRPVLILPGHVGWTIGQFVSRECKPEGWRYTGTKRELAQSKWAMLILSLGGDASFANR